MLVLARKTGQRIVIGEGASQVVVTVTDIDRGKVRLGVECDRSMGIWREELLRDNAADVARPHPAEGV